jgi:hypothetical protein
MKTTYFPRVQSNRVCRERKPLLLGYDRAKDPEKVVGLSRVTYRASSRYFSVWHKASVLTRRPLN